MALSLFFWFKLLCFENLHIMPSQTNSSLKCYNILWDNTMSGSHAMLEANYYEYHYVLHSASGENTKEWKF